MIFKIDHYYSTNHDKYSLMIETDISIKDLVCIVSSIQFLFEELIDDGICVDDAHLLELLKEFYHVKNVKEEYKKYLDYTHLKDNQWSVYNIFNLKKFNLKIVQIDLYEARESCCGPQYELIMNQYLPKGEELDKFKEKVISYKNYYI